MSKTWTEQVKYGKTGLQTVIDNDDNNVNNRHSNIASIINDDHSITYNKNSNDNNHKFKNIDSGDKKTHKAKKKKKKEEEEK